MMGLIVKSPIHPLSPIQPVNGQGQPVNGQGPVSRRRRSIQGEERPPLIRHLDPILRERRSGEMSRSRPRFYCSQPWLSLRGSGRRRNRLVLTINVNDSSNPMRQTTDCRPPLHTAGLTLTNFQQVRLLQQQMLGEAGQRHQGTVALTQVGRGSRAKTTCFNNRRGLRAKQANYEKRRVRLRHHSVDGALHNRTSTADTTTTTVAVLL